MKLKQWLREYKSMTYAEYKNLSKEEQYDISDQHRRFCRNQQIHDSQNWRTATDEEKVRLNRILEKEKKRYEKALKIGGIDGKGNYTALHYRWEERR